MTHQHAAWFTAAALLMAVVLTAAPQQNAGAERQLEAAIHREQVLGDVKGAIEEYKKLAQSGNRTVAAQAWIHLGQCYEKLGEAQAKDARASYERVVRDFADQQESSKVARERLSALTAGGGGAAGRTEVAMRRIWVAGRDLPISISPDGRYVVFAVFDSANLWLRDLQNGEQRQITRDGSRVESTGPSNWAAISPDGKWIAYSWSIKDRGEVRLSLLDGSSMRILHDGQDGRSMYVKSWMPDGRRILTASFKDLQYHPHIISLQDGSVRDIGQPEPGSVSWGYPSPDGRHIAYSLKGDIFSHDTVTEQASVLVKSQATDSMVGWTPDGSGIVFVSNRSGSRDLYSLGIENGLPQGEPQLLRRELGDANYLSLARDGRLFQIVRKGSPDSYILPVDEQTGTLTGTPSLVDPSYPGALFPAWSPDGKLLYYSMTKGPVGNRSQTLVIRSEETGQTREVSPKPKLPFWHTPILSPDGRRFVVTGADENKNSGIFSIDAESGEVKPLVMLPVENGSLTPNPNWSPDGKAIFYMVRSAGNVGEFIIRRKDLTTGEEQDVHRGANYRDIRISRDGTRFVYFLNDTPTKSWVLGILDTQSGKDQELWRGSGADYPGGVSGPTWTPDEKHVLLTAISLKQGNELWRFPVAGGSGQRLYFSPDATWGFGMHPSGKRVVFTQNRIGFELWVLENILPKASVAK